MSERVLMLGVRDCGPYGYLVQSKEDSWVVSKRTTKLKIKKIFSIYFNGIYLISL